MLNRSGILWRRLRSLDVAAVRMSGEWDLKDKTRIPYRFVMKDGEPFAMSGIWTQPQTNLRRLRARIGEVLKTLHHGAQVLPREAYRQGAPCIAPWIAKDVKVSVGN